MSISKGNSGTPHPSSGVQYLHGDEIAYIPVVGTRVDVSGREYKDGAGVAACHVAGLLYRDLVNKGTGHKLRENAFIVSSQGEMDDTLKPGYSTYEQMVEAQLDTMSVPRVRDEHIQRSKDIRQAIKLQKADRITHAEAYNYPKESEQFESVQQLEDFARTKEQKFRKDAKLLGPALAKFRKNVKQTIANGEQIKSIGETNVVLNNAFGSAPSHDEYQRYVDILESQSALFPPEYKKLFAASGYPVVIRNKPFVEHDKTQAGPTMFTTNLDHGVVLDSELVKVFDPYNADKTGGDKQADHYRETVRTLARAMTESAIALNATTLADLNIEEKAEWSAVRKEFGEHALQFMSRTQRLEDAKIPGDYAINDVICMMHYFLNAPSECVYGNTPDEIRAALPLSAQLYDRFRELTREKAIAFGLSEEELEAGGSDMGSGVRERNAHRPTPQPFPNPNSPFSPRPISEEPLEVNLIEDVKPFLERALGEKPPHTQCHVRLIPKNNTSQGGYPIRVVMRNSEKQDIEFTLNSGTDDLQLAQMLKMNLQSHLLSHPGIEPLWMSRIHRKGYGYNVPVDEMVPSEEPTGVKLINHFNFFAAELQFPTFDAAGEESTLSVRIPLGIEYDTNEPKMAEEALARSKCVESYLSEMRDKGEWRSVAEVTQHLKGIVLDENDKRPYGWRMGVSMPVEGYGDRDEAGEKRNVTLDFPLNEGTQFSQQTTIKSAMIRLENGPKYVNPSWRLALTIEISGLGPDGTEKYKLTPTLNLHTTDETAAQMNAITAIKSLEENAETLALTYPTMQWRAIDEDGHLIICDKDGNQPANPSPQNFTHLVEDMEQFKTNFQIVERAEERRTEDGKTYVTLVVKRGIPANNDLVDFNIPGQALNPEAMRLEFTVDAGEESKIGSIIDSMNQTFNGYIGEAYSNRTKSEDGQTIRKKRQEFNSRTIQNAFFEVFATEMLHGKTADSIIPRFARYRSRVVPLDEFDSQVQSASRKFRGEHPEPMFEDELDAKRKGGDTKAEAAGLRDHVIRSEPVGGSFVDKVGKRNGVKPRDIAPDSDHINNTDSRAISI